MIHDEYFWPDVIWLHRPSQSKAWSISRPEVSETVQKILPQPGGTATKTYRHFPSSCWVIFLHPFFGSERNKSNSPACVYLAFSLARWQSSATENSWPKGSLFSDQFGVVESGNGTSETWNRKKCWSRISLSTVFFQNELSLHKFMMTHYNRTTQDTHKDSAKTDNFSKLGFETEHSNLQTSKSIWGFIPFSCRFSCQQLLQVGKQFLEVATLACDSWWGPSRVLWSFACYHWQKTNDLLIYADRYTDNW